MLCDALPKTKCLGFYVEDPLPSKHTDSVLSLFWRLQGEEFRYGNSHTQVTINRIGVFKTPTRGRLTLPNMQSLAGRTTNPTTGDI